MNVSLSIFRLFWVAICALSMMAQTRLLLGMPLNLGWLDGFVFGGTVFGYYFTHTARLYRNIAWAAGFFGGVCLLIPVLQTSNFLREPLMVLAPVMFWLSYYGFQRPGKSGLRGHPLAKPLTIALTWAWVTVLLPTPVQDWPNLLAILLGRVLFVFSLALAYDVCDLEYDRQQGLPTLAVRLGFERSLALVYKSLFASGVCVCVNVYLHIYDLGKGAALLVSLALSAWCMYDLLQKKEWEHWQKPLIDGLMVLQFLLVLALSGYFRI